MAAADHGALFRQCLLDLDVKGIRALWRHVSPHLPQPATDDEALVALHMARVQSAAMPEAARAYSEHWMRERQGPIAHAVGIAVLAPRRRAAQAVSIRQEMEHAVTQAVREGVSIAAEPEEIRRRILRARDRA
jgi:hypothetical protein